MEEERHSLNLNFTTESAHLVEALLERHRHPVTMEQVDNPPDSERRNIHWVAIKDFTVEVGKTQIGEYINTWEMQPGWLYGLDFLYSSEQEHHTFYHYRARFSTPSPRRPIQGTASVYFVMDISKVKPQTLPVEVLFVVESSRLVHTPGRTRFREKWLADIIESKTLLRRAVDL
ncbi:A-kinase anchor protein 14 [Chelmon rostratus]|uniref:A-kinase anchor protein 14 n=1 Tax=Chelmon rostratus TaxID=109905 RepID=UPI001BE64A58|nr:A-kinase anchor protein 14 [Chelmon rostratus]